MHKVTEAIRDMSLEELSNYLYARMLISDNGERLQVLCIDHPCAAWHRVAIEITNGIRDFIDQDGLKALVDRINKEDPYMLFGFGVFAILANVDNIEVDNIDGFPYPFGAAVRWLNGKKRTQ